MTRSGLLLWLAFAAPVLSAACGQEEGSDSTTPSDPAAVVEGYVAAYNARDIDRVMTFFDDEAVIVGVEARGGGSDRIEGAAAIRAGTLDEFTVHAPGGEAYSISNLVVTGNAVTWDHLFTGIAHTCLGAGNEAVIEHGKIVVWTFASVSCE